MRLAEYVADMWVHNIFYLKNLKNYRKMLGNYLLVEKVFSSQEGLSCMELVHYLQKVPSKNVPPYQAVVTTRECVEILLMIVARIQAYRNKLSL
jgi:hypothetical protein